MRGQERGRRGPLCLLILGLVLVASGTVRGSVAGAAAQVPIDSPTGGPPGRLGFADDYVSAPAVVDKAAALGHDSETIFAFVRDEVAFESYRGVLRGAVGTLWTGAGNAADQAVLLHALLRESGLTARFARARLRPEQARSLIDSMFTPRLEPGLTGVVPSGAVADPASDPALLDEAADHVWVQLEAADGWVDLDPSFAGGPPASASGDSTTTLETLPEDLHQHLALRLRLERSGSDGVEISYPFEHRARVSDLAGRRVGFRHVPDQLTGQQGIEAAQLGRVLAARQRRFRPVLRIGDQVVVGEPFAAGEGLDPSSPLTSAADALAGGGAETEAAGLAAWLEIRLTAPGEEEIELERRLFSFPGAEAAADPQQAVLGAHLELYVAPHRVPIEVARRQIAEGLGPLLARHRPLAEEAARLKEADDDTGLEALTRESLLPLDVELWMELAHVANLMMASASDGALDDVGELLAVRAYYERPRLLIADLTPFATAAGGGAALRLDLRHDAVRALAYPGVDPAAELLYRLYRGFVEAALEGQVLEAMTGRVALTAPGVLAAAAEQGVELVSLDAGGAETLAALPFPAETRELIRRELEAGFQLVVPARPVEAPGGGAAPRVAWWRVDPSSGETVGVLDSGLHQGISIYTSLTLTFVTGHLATAVCPGCPSFLVDAIIGFDDALLAFAGKAIQMADSSTPWLTIRAGARRNAADAVASGVAQRAALGFPDAAAAYLVGGLIALQLLDTHVR